MEKTSDIPDIIPVGHPLSPFEAEATNPKTEKEALAECVSVLERIMRDGLLVGYRSCKVNKEGKIELPLFGRANQALKHAKFFLG